MPPRAAQSSVARRPAHVQLLSGSWHCSRSWAESLNGRADEVTRAPRGRPRTGRRCTGPRMWRRWETARLRRRPRSRSAARGHARVDRCAHGAQARGDLTEALDCCVRRLARPRDVVDTQVLRLARRAAAVAEEVTGVPPNERDTWVDQVDAAAAGRGPADRRWSRCGHSSREHYRLKPATGRRHQISRRRRVHRNLRHGSLELSAGETDGRRWRSG